MRLAAPVLAVALAACASGDAARHPEGFVDDAAYREAAALRYRELLAALVRRGRLDDDPGLLARVRRIMPPLVAAAARMRPESAGWSWEIHVTDDPATATFSLAGGKVVIGGTMVRHLDLTDGELAMLLAHEAAHSIAGHRRRATEAPAVDSDPVAALSQARIAIGQEDEADEIGMRLASSAGWPVRDLLGFFDKVAAAEGAGAFNATHASAAARAARARGLAASIGR